MPWEIPNYDSLKIPASDDHERDEGRWQAEPVELDLEELEAQLPSIRRQ
jgi:hypothetical protein